MRSGAQDSCAVAVAFLLWHAGADQAEAQVDQHEEETGGEGRNAGELDDALVVGLALLAKSAHDDKREG